MDVEKEKSGQLTDKEEPMDTDSVKLEAEIDLAKTAPDNHASKGADKSGFPPAEVKQEPGSEEDDDPVIHEIPVFLSRSISKLYLFQARICISKTSDSFLIINYFADIV